MPKSPVRLLSTLTIMVALALACSEDDGGDDDDGGDGDSDGGATGADGGTAGGSCVSDDPSVPSDVQSAISEVCTYFVACSVDTCDNCLYALEEDYLAQEPLVQEQYADALLCFTSISCGDLQAGDLSACTGDTCGGIWCGSSDSACQAEGCSACDESTGYCVY